MTITLRNTPTGWVAVYSDMPGSIPTAFTAQATAEMVLSAIQRLNPEYSVTVGR